MPTYRTGNFARQAGLTLLELMIAMVLGLGVTLTAMALLQAVRSSYYSVNDNALIQDSGRYALDVMALAIRQANFAPRDDPALVSFDPASLPPGILGLDNRRLAANTPDISTPQSNDSNHRSDVLAIRYLGAADNSILNCAGFAINSPKLDDLALLDNQRGWSIFYVATDSGGMPELRCKYSTRDQRWSAEAIVRGVAALHVLYGIGDPASGAITRYLPASQMTTAQWRQLLAVRIALLIRGEHLTQDTGSSTYRLFGDAYQNGDDAIVTISDPRQARQLHKIFDITVRLRNHAT